jgi:hypothetical protein
MMSVIPKENPVNSIADVTHDIDLKTFSSSLPSHLATAAQFQRAAQHRLKLAFFTLGLALVIPLLSLLLGSVIAK